jgi:hypothetical protein
MKPAVFVLALLCVLLALPASAGALTVERQYFSDPFGGDYSCEGFDATFEGHDRGQIADYFDAAGNPVKQVGHINSIETDTNLLTGKSVLIRTHITVHLDYVTGTWAITGLFNGGTFPKEGLVLQDVGRVEFDANGDPVVFHGVHDTFTKGEQAFCDALG